LIPQTEDKEKMEEVQEERLGLIYLNTMGSNKLPKRDLQNKLKEDDTELD
jgi:hypothetical protein